MGRFLWKYTSLLLALLVALLVAVPVVAQDITRLGGDLTSDRPKEVALELPAPNISSAELNQYHLDGHTDFHGSFEFNELNGKPILGPLFNHNSCGGCHIKNGRGAIGFHPRGTGSAMLVKVSIPGRRSDGSPRNVPGVGEQLRDHHIDGEPRHDLKLTWRKRRMTYSDGLVRTLRRPVLHFSVEGRAASSLAQSLRNTPPVIGMGLLEAIPDATLEALSDPDDTNNDGISGELQQVPNLETGGLAIGRFGFRASHPTLKQQTAAAFFHDMGLTSELFPPQQSSDQAGEISGEILDRTTFYLQAPGIPPARDQDNPDVVAGKALFQTLNCNACHVMTMESGDSSVVEVAHQEFHPFTDLLLHDMGPGLADRRAEYQANGREWRTTPLWGLGLYRVLSNRSLGFLHDGRARTIEEAILWHGGEARASQAAFRALSRAEREQLLKFLKSL